MKVYCRHCGYLLGPGYIEDQKQHPDGLCERCQEVNEQCDEICRRDWEREIYKRLDEEEREEKENVNPL